MKQTSGFTLVEVLIYLALFGLLFSGLFCAAVAIGQNIGRNAAQTALEQEGGFLLAKIENEKDAAAFSLEDGILKINGAALSGSDFDLSGLRFDDLGRGLAKASFVLTAKTGQGQAISREFSAVYFLPK